MMSRKKFLITGATGGLGVALVKEAARQDVQVVATGRSENNRSVIEGAAAEFIQCDLRYSDNIDDLFKGVTSVIHAAALSASWGPRQKFEAINLTATKRLLEASKSAECRTFIFISTPSIYACFQDQIKIQTNDAPRNSPLNDYAQTKLEAEKLVLNANDVALKTCAIRPRAIVGPYDQVLLPKLAKLAQRPRIPLFRGGRALIEFSDVRDVAKAVFEADKKIDMVSGEAMNISGAKPVTIKEVISKLSEALQVKPKTYHMPMTTARFIAHCSEHIYKWLKLEREPALTPYTLATLAYSQTFDHEEIFEKIGFRPQYDGFETLLELAKRGRE